MIAKCSSCRRRFYTPKKAKYCLDAQCKRARDAENLARFRANVDRAEIRAVLKEREYQPDKLILLAAAIVKMAYHDGYLNESGPKARERYEARKWMRTQGRAWVEVIAPNLEIPNLGLEMVQGAML